MAWFYIVEHWPKAARLFPVFCNGIIIFISLSIFLSDFDQDPLLFLHTKKISLLFVM